MFLYGVCLSHKVTVLTVQMKVTCTWKTLVLFIPLAKRASAYSHTHAVPWQPRAVWFKTLVISFLTCQQLLAHTHTKWYTDPYSLLHEKKKNTCIFYRSNHTHTRINNSVFTKVNWGRRRDPASHRQSLTSSRLTGVTAALDLLPFITLLTTQQLPAPPPLSLLSHQLGWHAVTHHSCMM